MRRVVADQHVPYAVQAALVDASGKLFWYWAPYKHYLIKAGVPAQVVARVTHGEGRNKYEVMRQVLAELDGAGGSGRRVQEQLLREAATMPLNGDDGIDLQAARDAQRRLRAVAQDHGLLAGQSSQQQVASEQAAAQRRRFEAQARQRKAAESVAKRQALMREYSELLANSGDKQGRGYRLEEMLGEIARLDGLRYTRPFRKGTVTQTDGMVSYEGFQYLAEARWRMDPPDVQAVAGLAHKVSRNLQSTRGLFLSVVGFRDEVVDELQTGVKNVLLVSGQELSLVLEGRITLGRALQLKVDEGAKKGLIFFDLGRLGAF